MAKRRPGWGLPQRKPRSWLPPPDQPSAGHPPHHALAFASAGGRDKKEPRARAQDLEFIRMDRFNLGSHSRTVSTASPEAQRWFDRGLNWCFGFNKFEGVRCFRKALE